LSTSGLEVFDTTLQKTQLWLKEIVTELEWQHNPSWAYRALRSVLHALHDYLGIEEATDLATLLPMLIRGSPTKDRH
jgi:uncharacterized protein (DUF2267 family)